MAEHKISVNIYLKLSLRIIFIYGLVVLQLVYMCGGPGDNSEQNRTEQNDFL